MAATASPRSSTPLRPAAGGGADYATFSSSSQGAGAPPVGLSTVAARTRLLAALECKIAQKERSPDLSTEFRDPFALLLALCAVFRFADLARRLAAHHAPRAWEALLEGLFLVAAAISNALLNRSQQRRAHAEMAERVRIAVKQMLAHDAAAQERERASAQPKPRPTMLLPSNSYVACYRDCLWQRLPMSLLVEGDVVGLMSGDIAPGDVSLLEEKTKEREGNENEAQVYLRGNKLPTWAGPPPAMPARSTATFNPSLLLQLCGEMRVFEMQETPVVRDIENALFNINRPETFTQKLQAKARAVAAYVCTIYSAVVVVAIGLRLVLQGQLMDTTLNHLLLGPIGVWLCFASLNTPFVLFIAEAAATGSILGAFQDVVLPKAKRKSVRQPSSPLSSPLTSPTNDNHEENTSSDEATFSPGSPPLDVMNPSDFFDVEDREKLRSEKPLTHSAFGDSLRYFLVALRFRTMECDQAHVSTVDTSRLPIPFRSFRLLERLGSTTMLCCFDDDILCDPTPSAEEIYLPNDKQGIGPTVLDLHLDRDCDTGLKFEDPRWRQHLPSLKPIGLAIMLNDTEDPVDFYETNARYLANETLCAIPEGDDAVSDPHFRTCLQRLAVHVRMLPFPKYLLNLSHEMGFDIQDDLMVFQRRQSIHIICPRLAHREHTNDHHDQGQEDSRYRGNLKSHMYSTVVLDKRCHRHQLLSRGHPTVVLSHCTEYWDGKSICPMTADKQRAILELYNQWRVEDLGCVALSYVPVPHKLNSLFVKRTDSKTPEAFSPRSRTNDSVVPPVYLVSDSTIGEDGVVQGVGKDLSGSDQQGPVGYSRRRSDVEIPLSPTSASETDKNTMLWQIQDDQIFLGMVATGIQPKKSIPDFIEDLDACGIRFVYFSPRNMRRSKLLAEKMGIETDWNCAISLRPLESDGPDPHRMTSNYSDWDVKARLPHGIDAIKRHLEEVDNVPLLVSLYTDSTQETISEMISVFQDNNEVVMGVGSSLKETNARLFAKADMAIGIQGKPRTFFGDRLQSGSVDWSSLCEEDIQFGHVLNTLGCSLRMKSVEDDGDNKGVTPSLPHLLELIRLGRRMLTNFHQMITFIFISQLQLATVITAAYLLPFPMVAQLSCASIFWLLWGLVPAVSLTMLASASEKDVMKKTPRKNEEIDLSDDLPRLIAYFIIRHVPSALVAIVVFECLIGFSLQSSSVRLDDIDGRYNDYQWSDFMLSNELFLLRPRPPAVTTAVDRAEAGMLLMIGLSVLASSCGYLYRTESLLVASPFRNRMWLGVTIVLAIAQVVISVLRAGLIGVDGSMLWQFVTGAIPWKFWLLFLVWPIVIIVVDEAAKAHDRAHLVRYYKFMRMQFDTRLGMWSPK